MKDKIEIGDYVRTKDGVIAKVTYVDVMMIDCDRDVFDLNNLAMMEIPTEYIEEYIVKHRKQLIDLIDVGDILKIKISEEWVEKQDTIKFVVVGQTYTITEIKECLENGLFKIIQILTKEKYNQECFEVVE